MHALQSSGETCTSGWIRYFGVILGRVGVFRTQRLGKAQKHTDIAAWSIKADMKPTRLFCFHVINNNMNGNKKNPVHRGGSEFQKPPRVLCSGNERAIVLLRPVVLFQIYDENPKPSRAEKIFDERARTTARVLTLCESLESTAGGFYDNGRRRRRGGGRLRGGRRARRRRGKRRGLLILFFWGGGEKEKRKTNRGKGGRTGAWGGEGRGFTLSKVCGELTCT